MHASPHREGPEPTELTRRPHFYSGGPWEPDSRNPIMKRVVHAASRHSRYVRRSKGPSCSSVTEAPRSDLYQLLAYSVAIGFLEAR
jgi:hypothetical protein